MITGIVKQILRRTGYELIKANKGAFPKDFTAKDIADFNAVRSYTQTGPECIYTLIEATRYVVQNNIPGAFVECGVFRGGSVLAMARTLVEMNRTDRDIWLYDTFEGMPAPTEDDFRIRGGSSAMPKFTALQKGEGSDWCAESLDVVRQRVYATKYPQDRFRFVQGKVEDTIPETIPDQIALLRLDTDWYESTKHELVHLWPRLAVGGVLIIDDYGHWAGARKAVDEFFEDQVVFLNRIDFSARIVIKR